MTDLKPCPNPWCDSHERDMPMTSIFIREVPINYGRRGFRATCSDCGILGPIVGQKCDALPAWNTRTDVIDLQTVLAYEAGQQSMQAEIERLREALKRQSAAVRSLHHNEETEINRLRAERTQWYYAISTLESERKANAILTSEIERLRLALEAKDALHVSAYQAGLKAGWNFCINDDGVGFAKATSGTDHIAELRRINEARTALGDTK